VVGIAGTGTEGGDDQDDTDSAAAVQHGVAGNDALVADAAAAVGADVGVGVDVVANVVADAGVAVADAGVVGAGVGVDKGEVPRPRTDWHWQRPGVTRRERRMVPRRR